MEELKKVACDAIDNAAAELHKLSDDIWNHPELGFQEKYAHQVLTQFLVKQGFQVEESYKLETAFRGTFGSESKPNICVISEFDALPEIGHACGHNLIAEVGVASAVGIMAAMKASNKPLGKLTILGTPAEEGFGGKIDLINAGAFQDIDVAMMSHPFPENDPTPIMLARENLEVTYTGKPSHAAGFPWEGINAVDAAVTCYNSIACLRQQMKPEWRVHCFTSQSTFFSSCRDDFRVQTSTKQRIKHLVQRQRQCLNIIKEGGIRVNIIPEKAVLQLAVRAPTDKDVKLLKEKVVACFHAAATATGCQMTYRTMDKVYSSVLHNRRLVELYEKNLEGFVTDDVPRNRNALCGSTDMGNVVHLMPSIHPHFYIGGVVVNHTRGFSDDAGLSRIRTLTGCPMCRIKNPPMTYRTMDKVYSSVLHNRHLVELYEKNLEAYVTDDVPRNRNALCGSTDMGNVAHLVPSIHPHFYIGGVGVNHTRGFTDDAGHDRAQKYTLIQAKAIAMTAVDIMVTPGLLQTIKDSFQTDLMNA